MSTTRRPSSAVLTAGTALLLASCTAIHPEQVDLLIRNVAVVSAERAAPLENAWVAIDGARIAAIGQGEAKAWRGDSEIDAAGRFLTPGLIDAHVHLSWVPGFPWSAYEEGSHLAPLVEEYHRQLPRSYLFHGFTTVVDLVDIDPRLLERLESSRVHPDVYHSGGALPLANGSGGWLGWMEGSLDTTRPWTVHVIAEGLEDGRRFAAGDLDAGDFDGDGDADVIGVAHPGEWTDAAAPADLFWFENPSWERHPIGRIPNALKDVAVEDFPVYVLLNQPDGWEPMHIHDEGIYNALAGDYDGDGDVDVFRYPAHDSEEFYVMVNQVVRRE